MVSLTKIFYLSVGVLIASSTLYANSLSFVSEFSKNQIFQGESVTIDYFVEGDAEAVEVEVSKFPEFRGFWSDNLALRQGPIALISRGLMEPPGLDLDKPVSLADLRRKFHENQKFEKRRALVGTYVLNPMVGKEDLKIEPMKIALRDISDANAEFKSVASTTPNLIVKPLPPVPPNLVIFFRGAVGEFSLAEETSDYHFRVGNPVLLRFILNGKGNFFEINEVPLTLPKEIEVLSMRSSIQGNGQFVSKLFEVVLAVHSNETITTEPNEFVYFNPAQGK